ncbi:DUF1932 domain-containing protein [Roseococcus sp. DSY-14]|uniref:NAD(P)-dependent oxidoreductase n=1 Tax=Roseococcus sp. DSY-14 TaxID=3369650 RepID=UPI00387B4F22
MRIALLGLGEVGGILAADLAARGWPVARAFDPARPDKGVELAAGAAEAVAGAQLVISAVTAAAAEGAARDAAPGLAPDAWFLDLNSCAPETKRAIAAVVEGRGARMVEAAVMAPVPPRRLRTPMLLGGPHAGAFLPVAAALGLDAQVFAGPLGGASAVKMCRSVMVKGLEALWAESLLAARHHGVERAVLDSLAELLPGVDAPELARYMIGRALVHGKRRAEEMREAARTVAEAGLEPLMAAATAGRQDWAAGRRAAWDGAAPLEALLDAIRRLD